MYGSILVCVLLLGAEPLPNGSLLFLENCNKFVERVTAGQVGHVALVFNDPAVTWVYEATPAQVRRVPLETYYQELALLNQSRRDNRLIRVTAYRPTRPYSAEESQAMRQFLDTQLGRRYSVKNYVTGHPGDGLHCAELTGNTLTRTQRFDIAKPQSVSPQSLQDMVKPFYLAEELDITQPAPSETWCEKSLRRWTEWSTWCQWSCGECRSYCW